MFHDDLHFMPPTTSFVFDDSRHQERMDRRYRYQRHVFDLSRKLILFGRDRAIAALRLGDACSVLEIGCGTGRNLKRMADAHPALRLIGIDISDEMLKSARTKFARAQRDQRVTLLHGDAVVPTDRKAPRILMAYSLSMVPDWRRALAIAIDTLEPGASWRSSISAISGACRIGWRRPASRCCRARTPRPASSCRRNCAVTHPRAPSRCTMNTPSPASISSPSSNGLADPDREPMSGKN